MKNRKTAERVGESHNRDETQQEKADEFHKWANEQIPLVACQKLEAENAQLRAQFDEAKNAAEYWARMYRAVDKIRDDQIDEDAATIKTLQSQLDEAKRQAEAYKQNFENELEGNRTLALEMGGKRDNETMRGFCKRVATELEEARALFPPLCKLRDEYLDRNLKLLSEITAANQRISELAAVVGDVARNSYPSTSPGFTLVHGAVLDRLSALIQTKEAK